MRAKDFDKKFDDGKEDIIKHLDMKTVKHPNTNQQRIRVAFPSWMLQSLDHESKKLGITRQSLIKIWIADKLESRKG